MWQLKQCELGFECIKLWIKNVIVLHGIWLFLSTYKSIILLWIILLELECRFLCDLIKLLVLVAFGWLHQLIKQSWYGEEWNGELGILFWLLWYSFVVASVPIRVQVGARSYFEFFGELSVPLAVTYHFGWRHFFIYLVVVEVKFLCDWFLVNLIE